MRLFGYLVRGLYGYEVIVNVRQGGYPVMIRCYFNSTFNIQHSTSNIQHSKSSRGELTSGARCCFFSIKCFFFELFTIFAI